MEETAQVNNLKLLLTNLPQLPALYLEEQILKKGYLSIIPTFRTVNLTKSEYLPISFLSTFERILKLESSGDLEAILQRYSTKFSLKRLEPEKEFPSNLLRDLFFGIRGSSGAVFQIKGTKLKPRLLVGPGYIEDFDSGQVLACIAINTSKARQAIKDSLDYDIQTRSKDLIDKEAAALTLLLNPELLRNSRFKSVLRFVQTNLEPVFVSDSCPIIYSNIHLNELFCDWHLEKISLQDLEDFSNFVYQNLSSSEPIGEKDMLLYGVI